MATLLFAGVSEPAAAQLDCDGAGVRALTGSPTLTGFRLLFQQNGVTFYGRVASGGAAQAAEVVIRNGNARPVEVSYSVVLEVAGDSLPRTIDLGRHCAQIAGRQYVVSSDSTPAPGAGLRVRNLTIANLAAGTPQAEPVPAVVAVDSATSGIPGPEPALLPAEEGAAAAPAVGAADVTAMADASPLPDAAPRRVPRHPRLWAPISPGSSVKDWALEATYAVFYLLSATILVIAGLGLVLPVLAAFVLLLVAGVRSLVGRRDAPSDPA